MYVTGDTPQQWETQAEEPFSVGFNEQIEGHCVPITPNGVLKCQ